MSKYKIVKMNTTDGARFTLNRVEPASKQLFNGSPMYAEELIPLTPIKYYKTEKMAQKKLKDRFGF